MFPQSENINTELQNNGDLPFGKSLIFDFSVGDFIVNDGRVQVCDGLIALKVWIEKILHTEKGRFKIYEDTEYGVVMEDLIVGHTYPMSFITSELRREIEKALIQNPEITGITDFTAAHDDSVLTVRFKVITKNTGIIPQEMKLDG